MSPKRGAGRDLSVDLPTGTAKHQGGVPVGLLLCDNCNKLRRELHEIRRKNIELRDKCTKLRSANVKLEEQNAQKKIEIDDAVKKSALDYKEFKDLSMKLEKRDTALQESKKTISRMVKNGQETRQLLQDTLNVKLRYEEIIKAIMENERKGNTHSVQEIIKKTEASKVVQIDKAKQAMK